MRIEKRVSFINWAKVHPTAASEMVLERDFKDFIIFNHGAGNVKGVLP